MSFNYSTIMDDDLSRDDPLFWSRPTPMNCNTVRVVGILLCIASFIGIVCNGALFYSFLQYKALRSPPNIFVMFIAGLGLFASCTILPLTGTSSIYCQWLYQRAGCQLSAMIAFHYGCASSYLLCGVSVSRCYMIIRPFKAKNVTVNRCVVLASIAVFVSFLWTLMPLMGWNEYTMEGARTSCCINWYDRRRSYISFTFFLFVFVYCIPLIVLFVANTLTMRGLKQMHDKIENGIQTSLNRKRVDMERRIARSIICTTCGFIFTWTPYAIALFVSAFRGKEYAVPPVFTFFSACFAKASVIWIPMIYIGTSTQFKLHFVNREVLDLQAGSNRVDAAVAHAPIIARRSESKP